MAKSNNQKMKILYLLDLFQNPEAEGMIYSMQEIVAILAEKGVRAERKSIYDDLEVLRAFGLDIRFRKGIPSGYYLAGEKEITSFVSAQNAKVQEVEIEEILQKEVQEETYAEIKEEKPEEASEEQDQMGYRLSCDSGELKEIKLSCTEDGKAEVFRVFGEDCSCKQKEVDRYQMQIKATIGNSFYGWLLSNGNEIRLQKPKKEAAAFRDYLKGVAKGYKDV